MQYRNFGRSDWQPSALGFGTMRLPTTDSDGRGPNIDEAEAIRMLRFAIENGVNYFDTAYFYHGGNSERVLGKALLDGYRDKVRVATKSPVLLIQQPEDFDRLLSEQLARLQTDHVDFYMFHGLGQKSWREIVLKQGLLQRAEHAISDGRIRSLGFSFHDDFVAFEEILSGYDRWNFCQIQYNFMDIENQAGTAGLKLAAEKGLAVVVMEPLLGGRLTNPPAPIQEVYDHATTKRSPADWALQWIWDQPEVSTVLSGMSTMDQVKANIASAADSKVHQFGPEDQAVIEVLRRKYTERAPVPCTKCGYCMPCPSSVNIPRNLEMYNEARLHDDFAGSRYVYQHFFPAAEHAEACAQCKECEEKCPQKIPISDWLQKVSAELA